MKNKEKYAKEIVEIVCEGCALAVSKETGKPVKCVNIKCSECTLGGSGMCSTMIKEWAESEYTMPGWQSIHQIRKPVRTSTVRHTQITQ